MSVDSRVAQKHTFCFLFASSCSCFSLACRLARSSSALFLSSSSFCFAMFSKRALILPALLPAKQSTVRYKLSETVTTACAPAHLYSDLLQQDGSSDTPCLASPPPQTCRRSEDNSNDNSNHHTTQIPADTNCHSQTGSECTHIFHNPLSCSDCM